MGSIHGFTTGTVMIITGCLAFIAGCSGDGSGGGRSGGASSGGTGSGATGSGGTGGGGSGTSGGTGNGSGGTVAVETCPSVQELLDGNGFITDFECLNQGSDPVWKEFAQSDDGLVAGAYVYGHTMPEDWDDRQTWTADQVTYFGGLKAGHDSATALGYELTKPDNNWGAGLGIWMSCVDPSAYTGISFWSKGSSKVGTVKVTFNTFETRSSQITDPNQGSPGACPGADNIIECPPFEYVLELTPDWTLTTLSWSDFVHPMTKEPYDGATLYTGFNFHGDTLFGKAETMQFWIDDVSFTGGTPMAPECTPNGGGGGAGGSSGY